MAPLGKYSSVFSTPKIARGISGSDTRTMMRNIMLISANAVKQTTTNMRNSRSGSNGIGMPAMRLPTIMIEQPASTALMVPERLKPATSSSLLIGVTR